MKELIEYIRNCQALGFGKEEINDQLRQAGWDENQIREAWLALNFPPRETETPSVLPGSEETQKPSPAWYRNKKILIIIATALLLTLGGGYFAYAQFSSNPDRVWQQALSRNQPLKSVQLKVEGRYHDTPPPDLLEPGDQFVQFLNLIGGYDATLAVEGGVRNNNPAQTDFTFTIKAGLRVGTFSAGYENEIRKIGANLYHRVTENQITQLLRDEQTRETNQWLKIALGQNGDQPQARGLLVRLGEERVQKIRGALKNFDFFTAPEFLGEEDLGGEKVYRYRAAVEENALREAMGLINEIFESEGKEAGVLEAGALADRLEITDTEVWIGKKDRRIHQITLRSNFSSLLGARILQLRREEADLRDSLRATDIQRLNAAIRAFQEANRRYPASADGFPMLDDGDPPFSNFLNNQPLAPKPPDGVCTAEQNRYLYEPLSGGSDYKLTFCLGSDQEPFLAGRNEITSRGIFNLSDSRPDTPNLLAAAPLTGTVDLTVTFSRFNQEVVLEEPAGAIDYFEKLRREEMARKNTEEVANVNQVAAALTRYFNDSRAYPQTLEELTFGTAGQAPYLLARPRPLNTTGECAGIDLNYNYRPLNDRQSYLLEFCLTEQTGSFAKGKHQITPEGVQ